ncbi:MAG: type 2 lantipeptide synthetase LanM [Lachnospiraceae bacterium]|nr:type 2 lantipeptide synthetase LanM [Lachnospiraceae bacterium]
MTKEEMKTAFWAGKKDYWRDDEGAFDGYYQDLGRIFRYSLEEECQKRGWRLPALSSDWQDGMAGQLRQISLRTLILEMELCNRVGELKGNDKKAHYECFVREYLEDKEYLKELYQIYPVMYEAIFLCLERNQRNLLEALERWEADRREISDRFFGGQSCKTIEEISGGNSDSHWGGRRVLVFLFDNKERLVYKPRSLALDEAYQDFVRWIALGVGIDYRWNTVWNRGEYGWCGWVNHRSCTDHGQLKRYYRRNGILMCAGYVLGSGDMHYENLIAHGEYPVAIDLEMGLTSRGLPAKGEKVSETERIYRESVLHTGLLPLYQWNEQGEGVNVSAISGESGQLIPVHIPVVVNAGTVEMGVEYRRTITKESRNLALLNGEFHDPFRYMTEMEEGFEKGWNFLIVHREEAGRRIASMARAPVRFLIRDTMSYSMMLMLSSYPGYLVGDGDREKILGQVVSEGKDKDTWAGEQETIQLEEWDIPYFWYYPGETRLYSATGEVCDGYFSEPVLRQIDRRLAGMEEKGLIRQKRLICSALRMSSKAEIPGRRVSTNRQAEKRHVPEAGGGVSGSTEEMRILLAKRLGRILWEEAIRSEDGTEAGWISMMVAGYREQGCLIRPAGDYLYDGIAGIALFMTFLWKKTEKEDYRKTGEVLCGMLYEHTCALKAKSPEESRLTGAFTGEASILYAYRILYEITGDESLTERMKEQARSLAGCLPDDRTYDVLGGNAGAVLVLLNIYELTKDQEYLEWAIAAGDCLCQAATRYDFGWGWVNDISQKALTGYAHGACGMMLALAKLGYYTKDPKYDEAAYQAFCYEEHYYLEKYEDWEDLRYSEEDQGRPGYTLAWCHGRGGILAARKSAAFYAGDRLRAALQSKQALYWWGRLRAEDYEAAGDGYCLCHGKWGNVALMWRMGEREKAKEWERRILQELCEVGEKIKNGLPMQECENYGLMGGLAGIGCGALVGVEELGKWVMVEWENNFTDRKGPFADKL